MDRCSSCGHARAEHWPAASVPLGGAEQRDGLEALYASIDRLAGAEAEWAADRESACKVCHCSYYLGATDVTWWNRLVQGETEHRP
jgi:hypothetical protein